jgi:hypothetical protein
MSDSKDYYGIGKRRIYITIHCVPLENGIIGNCHVNGVREFIIQYRQRKFTAPSDL